MKIGKVLIWLAIAAAGALALSTSRSTGMNLSAPCGWWWRRFAVMRWDTGFIEVHCRKSVALDVRGPLRRSGWKTAAILSAPINGWFSDITLPPSPDQGRWSGPVLAAQFGYLTGHALDLVGAVFGGCVQDFVILLFSVRRDGKSLGQMAREEIGKTAGGGGLCPCSALS